MLNLPTSMSKYTWNCRPCSLTYLKGITLGKAVNPRFVKPKIFPNSNNWSFEPIWIHICFYMYMKIYRYSTHSAAGWFFEKTRRKTWTDFSVHSLKWSLCWKIKSNMDITGERQDSWISPLCCLSCIITFFTTSTLSKKSWMYTLA